MTRKVALILSLVATIAYGSADDEEVGDVAAGSEETDEVVSEDGAGDAVGSDTIADESAADTETITDSADVLEAQALGETATSTDPVGIETVQEAAPQEVLTPLPSEDVSNAAGDIAEVPDVEDIGSDPEQPVVPVVEQQPAMPAPAPVASPAAAPASVAAAPDVAPAPAMEATPVATPAVAETAPAAPVAAPVAASSRVWYVKADGVSLRSQPNTQAASVRTLTKGDNVLVTVEGEWGRLADNSYVPMSSLSQSPIGRAKGIKAWNQPPQTLTAGR